MNTPTEHGTTVAELIAQLADERAGAEILDNEGMAANDELAVMRAMLRQLASMVIDLSLATPAGLNVKDYARECEARAARTLCAYAKAEAAQ